MKHLLSAGDLTRDEAEQILTTAAELRELADRPIKKLPALRGRTVVNLFFEDSTRTRISFEAAAKRLSADVINFAAKGSSVSKGESLKDTALTLEAMGADAVVGTTQRQRRPAPTGALRLDQLPRRQRRGRVARAPHPGAARRVHAEPHLGGGHLGVGAPDGRQGRHAVAGWRPCYARPPRRRAGILAQA